jgi:hypothetical protein
MKKKTKVKKPSKPLETKVKKRKIKIVKKKYIVPINQLENLKEWLSIWEKNKKLPYSRIVCSACKTDFIGLKGIGMAHAKKKFDGDMKRILTESICKNCKPKPAPVEKKEQEFLSREEMEIRREKIRATLPKFDPHKEKIIIDLKTNKEKCKEYTYFSCHRPDIYLDYGCSECVLIKHCACPIKDASRIADGRAKKKKK